jgi:hypothetical protein
MQALREEELELYEDMPWWCYLGIGDNYLR